MKKKILDALTAKFQGVDAKILDRYATKMAKTVTKEEDVEPAVEGTTFQDILTSYGDARATEASQTAVSNYEKKHGLKDGKKLDQTGTDEDDEPDEDEDEPVETKKKPKAKPAKKDDETMPAWAKAMMDSIKKQSERLDAMDKGKVSASRREKLNKVIEKLTDKQKKPYGRMTLDTMSDEEFDTFIEEVKADADEMAAENEAAGATFGAPLAHESGAGKKATEKEIDSIADAMNI